MADEMNFSMELLFPTPKIVMPDAVSLSKEVMHACSENKELAAMNMAAGLAALGSELERLRGITLFVSTWATPVLGGRGKEMAEMFANGMKAIDKATDLLFEELRKKDEEKDE